ncbi:tRNA pseudouridine(38-40) synthase TruA [Aestuariispira insulae]|uniref:tRNA pseudouridine synthase A n=1 Tax=Aestuariispira insulae TaxID=1461337 RepID=A0A3D9HEY5_9PROT|nr:tRNA pseudouridine(38-40) synthase TruA [Aestuariispira insulae]RED48047.1 tRNA pseudouridine(38-40) synthase [Aestuariispira insulae]
MARWKIRVEYNGGPFSGWQRQDDRATVQGELEAAIFRFSGEEVLVQGAGRTDAGVHATNQAAHFDLERDFPALKIREALNAHLRQVPISVLEVEAVEDDFNARFDALSRAYIYRLLNRRAPPALDKGRVWHVKVPLDVALMDDAAKVLLGQHDFSSFRAAECQAKSPVKTLDRLDVVEEDGEIRFHVGAKSFLHHQVRNFVGSLKLVGEGKWTKADLKSALEACDRAAGGPTAPAQGLYLTEVNY